MIKLLAIQRPNSTLVTYPIHALRIELVLSGEELTIFNVYSNAIILALSADNESQKEKLITLEHTLVRFITQSPSNLALLRATDPFNPDFQILETYEPENSKLMDKLVKFWANKFGIIYY